jgi:hypothetical protein
MAWLATKTLLSFARVGLIDIAAGVGFSPGLKADGSIVCVPK